MLWLFPFATLSAASFEAVNDDDFDLIVEFSIVNGRRVNVRIP